MKHAFIITAYRDFDWIMQSINHYTQMADCYIHVDKKVKMPKEFIEWAQNAGGVYLFSKYKINWGSYKHLSSVLYMLKQARKNKDYEFYHILSANTILTKSLTEVLSFFEADPHKNYLDMVALEGEYETLIEPWYIYYHFLHLYNKRTNWGNQFDWYFCKVQKRLGIRRKLSYKYRGLIYSHLTKEFMDYVFDYLKKHPSYFRVLKTCNIGEEFFFQNIIADSPYKDTVVNNHMIFTKWTEGGVAKFLDDNDYHDIVNSEYLFARKYNENTVSLIEKLGSYKKLR